MEKKNENKDVKLGNIAPVVGIGLNLLEDDSPKLSNLERKAIIYLLRRTNYVKFLEGIPGVYSIVLNGDLVENIALSSIDVLSLVFEAFRLEVK